MPSTAWWRWGRVPYSPSDRDVQRIAGTALAEDGEMDITTSLTVVPGRHSAGEIQYRGGGVISGLVFADAVAAGCDCTIKWHVSEGGAVVANARVGEIRGELAKILRAERPMLNLLQRASGIASITGAFVDEVRNTSCRILHTRKTAPGLRALDVAAVIAGGGHRHRVDLAHEIMVKDNHWQALERHGTTLAQALAEGKRDGIAALYVEVESLEQLELACAAGATRLLIDNQPPDTVKSWSRRARQRSPGIEIEATGGISLQNVRAYSDAGADFISIGALTHSAKAADIALKVKL
jgi:nicotinate-nucleotide pyrophosphorylase (carboxylating)